MIDVLSRNIHSIFANEQHCYLDQQDDGTYRKKYGIVTPKVIQKTINNSDSIALYQKNPESYIKWICFDFDVLKKQIIKGLFEEAFNDLKVLVKSFCAGLEELTIPYLLEFSGNRGFHIWITFSEPVPYSLGSDILESILQNINPKYDNNLIGIDLFPQSKIATDGVGKGVKMPLSKHKRSNLYSVLLEKKENVDGNIRFESLDGDLVKNNIAILEQHRSISLSEIEKILGTF